MGQTSEKKTSYADTLTKGRNENVFKREWIFFKKNHELFLIFLPGALLIFIFAYLPMFGIIVAFKNYRFDLGLLGSEWIGFKNFEFFLSQELFPENGTYEICFTINGKNFTTNSKTYKINVQK